MYLQKETQFVPIFNEVVERLENGMVRSYFEFFCAAWKLENVIAIMAFVSKRSGRKCDNYSIKYISIFRSESE